MRRKTRPTISVRYRLVLVAQETGEISARALSKSRISAHVVLQFLLASLQGKQRVCLVSGSSVLPPWPSPAIITLLSRIIPRSWAFRSPGRAREEGAWSTQAVQLHDFTTGPGITLGNAPAGGLLYIAEIDEYLAQAIIAPKFSIIANISLCIQSVELDCNWQH